jgi:hypothetical protein
VRVWLCIAVAAVALAGCGDATPSASGFCDRHACIDTFAEGSGSVVQCSDGMWSHSGGVQGACSGHDGTDDPWGSGVSEDWGG